MELKRQLRQGALFSAYANFTAYQRGQGENINSSQFSFDPDDLAYIRNHYIFLDHDQTYTAIGRGLLQLPRGDAGGLREAGGRPAVRLGPARDGGSTVPNGAHRADYLTGQPLPVARTSTCPTPATWMCADRRHQRVRQRSTRSATAPALASAPPSMVRAEGCSWV